MWEYWKAYILEAFPIQYVLPLIVVLGSLYCFADIMYGVYVDSKEAVVEVVDDIQHSTYISWKDVADEPVKVSEVLHMVSLETDRVLRI